MKIHKTKILFATGILGVLTATAQSQVYMCKPCSAGQYAEKGSTSCKTCEAGYYSQVGASSCTKCGTNEYSKAGASSCTKCGADEVSDGTKCIKCGEFQYVKNGKCTDISYTIETTIVELSAGDDSNPNFAEQTSGMLPAGYYVVILGGGNGGNAFHTNAPILTTKSKGYTVSDDDPRTANIGGRGAKLQYVFKLDKNTNYRLAAGADGGRKSEHNQQQAGGGGASWLELTPVGKEAGLQNSTYYLAGGGGGRSGITSISCNGGAQGGFGGGLGAGGGGGDHYDYGSGMRGGNSGDFEGGKGGSGKRDNGGKQGGGFIQLYGDCHGGGCCLTGGIGGVQDGQAAFFSRGHSSNSDTNNESKTFGKYGGVGGFCTLVRDKYEKNSKCFFKGGGCASCGDNCNPSEEIAKFQEKFGDGDDIRETFNELDAIGSGCINPMQEFEVHNKANISYYYIRHPGNGKSNVQSNTTKFNNKLCDHCAKLYKLKDI